MIKILKLFSLTFISLMFLIACQAPSHNLEKMNYECNGKRVSIEILEGVVQKFLVNWKPYDQINQTDGFNITLSLMHEIIDEPHFQCGRASFRVVFFGKHLETGEKLMIGAYDVEDEGRTFVVDDFKDTPKDLIKVE